MLAIVPSQLAFCLWGLQTSNNDQLWSSGLNFLFGSKGNGLKCRKSIEPNKRSVWLNKSISYLTLQYIAFTHVSLSNWKMQDQKGYMAHYLSKRGTRE